MKAFPILYLLLSASLILASCTASRSLDREETLPGGVFGEMDSTYLFRASIKAMKRNFSSLVLVKLAEDEGNAHIVFLSELGPNLLELRYANDEFQVVKVQEFLNRKSLIRMMENDFRSLLLDLHDIDRYSISPYGEMEKVLKFRHRSQKYAYYYKEGSTVSRIRRRPGIFHKVDVCIERMNGLTISFRHSGIRMTMKLKQIVL